jgi:hypothetical protein
MSVPLKAAVLATLLGAAVACDRNSAPDPTSRVDRHLWSTAWEQATESQRAALKDGELTFAEYEAAALRTVQCVNEKGMAGEAIFRPASRTYEVGARWQSTGDVALNEQNRQESDACYAEHWNGISQAWSAQNQPSEQTLQEARKALADCLREAGLELPEPPGDGDFAEHRASAAFPVCVRKTQEEFGLPNFGG